MAGDQSDDGKERKGPGRHAFVASDEQRAAVAKMASERLGHALIAGEIGVSVPTLRKAFAAELKERLGDENLFAAAGGDAPSPQPAPKRKPKQGAGGRKRYAATDRDREKVKVLVASGMPLDRIARVMGISEPTLRRAFRDDIEHGADEKRAEILVALHRTALKGNVAAQKEAIAIMDRARLEQLQDQVRGKAAPSPAPEQKPDRPDIGKKAQADLDAHGVVTKGPWADLVSRKPHSSA